MAVWFNYWFLVNDAFFNYHHHLIQTLGQQYEFRFTISIHPKLNPPISRTSYIYIPITFTNAVFSLSHKYLHKTNNNNNNNKHVENKKDIFFNCWMHHSTGHQRVTLFVTDDRSWFNQELDLIQLEAFAWSNSWSK